MREKRQHQRAELEVPVQIIGSDERAWTTMSVDISVGGMFLHGDSLVAIGEEVKLVFEMPRLGEVAMPAYVRWSSARGFGVQFGLIGPRETHAIGVLVRTQPAPV